jgi:hypothetical protein
MPFVRTEITFNVIDQLLEWQRAGMTDSPKYRALLGAWNAVGEDHRADNKTWRILKNASDAYAYARSKAQPENVKAYDRSVWQRVPGERAWLLRVPENKNARTYQVKTCLQRGFVVYVAIADPEAFGNTKYCNNRAAAMAFVERVYKEYHLPVAGSPDPVAAEA